MKDKNKVQPLENEAFKYCKAIGADGEGTKVPPE